MNDIGIFNKIFGRFLNNGHVQTNLSITSNTTSSFTSLNMDIYELAVVRSCINAIATNAAKLKAVHIKRVNGVITPVTSKQTTNIISKRPNPLMSAFDFYYKMITYLYNKNNSFALIERGVGGLTGLYPISYSVVEALEYENEVFIRFGLVNGKRLTVPYSDLIHLRKFYYDNELFGEDNSALNSTLEVIEVTNEGLSEATKSSAILRGILKFSTMLKPEDLKAQRDDFVSDYLDISNNGGVAATDAKMEYIPLASNPVLVDAQQMTAIRDQLYMYFNVNESIVMNDYSPDQWNAFYESVLEPLAIQMSEEFTHKIFSKQATSLGNEIMYEANRMAYASNDTKIKMVKEVGVLGALTINEIREVFNMVPITGGDKRVQTLNVINADNADAHQSGGDTDV